MLRFKKTAIVLITIAALQLPVFNSVAAAADPSYTRDDVTGMVMAADLVLVRPLGFVGTVLGTAVFIVSLPFSALGGNVEEVYTKTMAEPAAFTFKRPLGHSL